MRIDHFAVLIKDKLNLRQIEVDHPRLLAPSADQSRERVHILAYINDVLRVRRIRFRVFLRFFHVPIDQRLRLEVGHSLRGFD